MHPPFGESPAPAGGQAGDESNDRRRSLSQPPPRSRPGGRKPNGPFCWQDKRWLGLIRKETEDYASGLSVYLALTELASDNESDSFKATHAWLAKLSGLSEKTIRRRLRDLKRIRAVKVFTPPMKAPCTYTLLPFGHGDRTLSHGDRTFGHGEGVSVTDIRRIEEEKPVSPRATANLQRMETTGKSVCRFFERPAEK